MFKPNVTTKTNAFARKYKKFLDGTLDEEDAKEKSIFEAYIARLKADELEDDPETNQKETNPIKYGDMEYENF